MKNIINSISYLNILYYLYIQHSAIEIPEGTGGDEEEDENICNDDNVVKVDASKEESAIM